MKVTFLGATHEVTGSCTMIDVAGYRILIDCGMEQGVDMFENVDLPLKAAQIDAVILTHAHIDHSGKLPLLYKNGFSGSIYSTGMTRELCSIMLRDSAHIQMMEAEWKNRKAKRSGGEEIAPMYDVADAERTMEHFVPCDYGEKVKICEKVTIRFTDVGHLLGSSAVEIWLSEGEEKRKIVFSGDVGNTHQPILRDPQKVLSADYLVVESTYGDRLHPPRPDYVKELAKCISRAFDRGGNVVIPSFAVGRTQEMLYFLRRIKEEKLVPNHPSFPVYIDSPLAVEATRIFTDCPNDYFDDETRALVTRGINPIMFDDLLVARTSEESKAINSDTRPKVIISASGMCEAGRIRHHLKHNLWRAESLILFVGYQANGTLGRALVEGAKEVRLFGEDITVAAEICVLAGVSGHADRDGLASWVSGFSEKPRMVFVNHGDDASCKAFASYLHDELGMNADAPYSGTEFDLISGRFVRDTDGVPATPRALRQSASSSAFDRLMGAAARLTATAKRLENMSNKDKARFASQIDALNDKWKKWVDS